MKWRWGKLVFALIFAIALLALPQVARAEDPWHLNARVLSELQDAAPSQVVKGCTEPVAKDYRDAGNQWIDALAEKIEIAPRVPVSSWALTCALIEWNWQRGEKARQLFRLPYGDLGLYFWDASFAWGNENFRDLFNVAPRLYRFISDDGRAWGYNCYYRVPCAF